LRMVSLKKFQQVLNMPRVLFAIAHPSMLRRLSFSHMEALPLEYASGLKVGSAYGYPEAIPIKYRGDIHFEKEFYTHAMLDPFEWMLKELKAQGVEFKS